MIACTFRYTRLYYTFSIVADRDSSKFHYFLFAKYKSSENKSAGYQFYTVHFVCKYYFVLLFS